MTSDGCSAAISAPEGCSAIRRQRSPWNCRAGTLERSTSEVCMAASARGSHSEFRTRVIRVVRRIPSGRVATYGDVAQVAGRPRAWRAVGTIMRTCDQPGVPCHRVIASGGRLGGYGGSEALKAALLRAEGILVVNGRVRRFKTVRWTARREASADGEDRLGHARPVPTGGRPEADTSLPRRGAVRPSAKAGPAAPKRERQPSAKAGQRG